MSGSVRRGGLRARGVATIEVVASLPLFVLMIGTLTGLYAYSFRQIDGLAAARELAWRSAVGLEVPTIEPETPGPFPGSQVREFGGLIRHVVSGSRAVPSAWAAREPLASVPRPLGPLADAARRGLNRRRPRPQEVVR